MPNISLRHTLPMVSTRSRSLHLRSCSSVNAGARDAGHVIPSHASASRAEVSLVASAKLYEFQRGGAQGQVIETEVVPEDRGISRASLEALYGGTAEDNARILMSIFDGQTAPR